ncbi:MAG: glycosyltransferase family 2 protein [Cyclobacteriaceae bacterium]|nr:glycosyltransferase family 2 protein [Cyclobacteriaceae bacterium]
MELSVVVTLFNEEDNVRPLLKNIQQALRPIEYEIILVDDGSTDKTVERIMENFTPELKLVRLSTNYGQTAAMAAGIAVAKGDYIATMDGDLQNDAADIPAMLLKLTKEGWDVVAGNRVNRKDGFIFRKLPSQLANALIRWLSGVSIKDYGCTLKVFRKEIAKNLGLYGELHRFIPILAVMQGGKITQVHVRHHPRLNGKSKYGMGRTLKVVSDLLLMVFFKKYLKRPIHFFGPLGLFSFLLGFGISFYLLIIKIMGQDIWGRPLLILGVTLILAGIQFLTFGVITELMMRTYYESQQKPTYTIREIIEGKETIPRLTVNS